MKSNIFRIALAIKVLFLFPAIVFADDVCFLDVDWDYSPDQVITRIEETDLPKHPDRLQFVETYDASLSHVLTETVDRLKSSNILQNIHRTVDTSNKGLDCLGSVHFEGKERTFVDECHYYFSCDGVLMSCVVKLRPSTNGGSDFYDLLMKQYGQPSARLDSSEKWQLEDGQTLYFWHPDNTPHFVFFSDGNLRKTIAGLQ
jgi:hypothetical protein